MQFSGIRALSSSQEYEPWTNDRCVWWFPARPRNGRSSNTNSRQVVSLAPDKNMTLSRNPTPVSFGESLERKQEHRERESICAANNAQHFLVVSLLLKWKNKQTLTDSALVAAVRASSEDVLPHGQGCVKAHYKLKLNSNQIKLWLARFI
jgi:hypothetical protein